LKMLRPFSFDRIHRGRFLVGLPLQGGFISALASEGVGLG